MSSDYWRKGDCSNLNNIVELPYSNGGGTSTATSKADPSKLTSVEKISKTCLIIANVWVQGGDQHEWPIEQFLNPVLVGADAGYAFLGKSLWTVGQQTDWPQDVGDHHWLEGVELKLAVATANCTGHVVTHHLSGHHCDRFALCGVHFTYWQMNSIYKCNQL